MAEQERAKKFFAELPKSDRWSLGDALVLGDFDWRDWLHRKPTSVFLDALDTERINWEIVGEEG